MTPRVPDNAGKGCFSGVHNRQTHLTSRHVTTAQNMSARNAMDQKELEDRLAAAEALSSLGSIASVAAAFKDPTLAAQVCPATDMAPRNDKPSKGETRGRGGGRKKDEKGTGRETKSRSTRGRGRAKVVQADRTSTTSAITPPTFPIHVQSLPSDAVPLATTTTTTTSAPKPASSRGRGRPRGRGGGGKQGNKSTVPVGLDRVASTSDSIPRPESASHPSESSPGTLAWSVVGNRGIRAVPVSGDVAKLHMSPAVGKSVHRAALVPSLTPVSRYVGVTCTVSSSVNPSTMSSTSISSSVAGCSSSFTSYPSSTPLTSTTASLAPSAPSTPILSLPSQPNLTSLRLDSLTSLSLGSSVLPNLPSVPNLPSLPSAIPSLQLGGASTQRRISAVPEESVSSQLSPQSRDSGEKSLPLKKRKVIDSLSSSSSSSSALSLPVPKANPVSPVSPSVSSPADLRAPALTVPSTSASVTEKSSDEVVSPAPVLPINLLPQVLPPAMCTQLLSEIKTAITPDEDGDVPLHIAVVHENEAMVKKLIQLMALAGQKVDRYNKQHQTPLHLAVKLTSLSAMEMLLEAGADPNLVDSGGLTSTHMAVQGRDIDCLEALLQWSKFPCDLDYRNFEGLAPIHTAVMNNDLEIVTRLLEQGADVNIMDGKSGRTVLFHAAETNQKAAVELLLNRGADPEIANYAGVVPALAAQGRNHTAVARLLARALEEGAEAGGEKGGTTTMEDGGKEKEREAGVQRGASRGSPPGALEAPVLEERGRSPRPSMQELGRRLSASSAVHIRHVVKTGALTLPSPTTAPPAPPILQSSSVLRWRQCNSIGAVEEHGLCDLQEPRGHHSRRSAHSAGLGGQGHAPDARRGHQGDQRTPRRSRKRPQVGSSSDHREEEFCACPPDRVRDCLRQC
ncbi:uncharacterized protein LOC143291654 [Babylonia areolata]|uniref:uncharacterized protein LOC143291654 n=1 Tax=Babylonia areolata TaxID=304850 RepID=UPI003FD0AE7C